MVFSSVPLAVRRISPRLHLVRGVRTSLDGIHQQAAGHSPGLLLGGVEPPHRDAQGGPSG